MLDLHMEAVDVIEQTVEGLEHHRHVPVEPAVVRLLFTVQHDQRITHHAQAMGVGEGDRTGQQTCFANPFQAGRVAIAIEYMDAGKTGLQAGRAGARFDHGDTGEDVMTLGTATAHIAMADAHTGDIGDGIERAGLQLAKLDVEVAGTWFHGFIHLRVCG